MQGPFLQGPFKEDLNRISTRSSHKDLCKIMQGPLGGFHQDHFARACAVEMHMDMSQEPVVLRGLTGKTLQNKWQMAYLDLSPALTPTVTTPLGRHCLGNHWFLYEFDTHIKFWMIFGVPHGSRNSRMVMEWWVQPCS